MSNLPADVRRLPSAVSPSAQRAKEKRARDMKNQSKLIITEGPKSKESQCVISPTLIESLKNCLRTDEICISAITYYLTAIGCLEASVIREIVEYVRNPELSNREASRQVRRVIPYLSDNRQLKIKYVLTQFIMNTLDPISHGSRNSWETSSASTSERSSDPSSMLHATGMDARQSQVSQADRHPPGPKASRESRAGSKERSYSRTLHLERVPSRTDSRERALSRSESRERALSRVSSKEHHGGTSRHDSDHPASKDSLPLRGHPSRKVGKEKGKRKGKKGAAEKESVEEEQEIIRQRLIEMGSLRIMVDERTMDDIVVQTRGSVSIMTHAMRLRAGSTEVAEGVGLLRALSSIDMESIEAADREWENSLTSTRSSQGLDERDGVSGGTRAGTRDADGGLAGEEGEWEYITDEFGNTVRRWKKTGEEGEGSSDEDGSDQESDYGPDGRKGSHRRRGTKRGGGRSGDEFSTDEYDSEMEAELARRKALREAVAPDAHSRAKSYYESKGIAQIFEMLLSSLVLERPTNPLEHLIELTGRMKKVHKHEKKLEKECKKHSCPMCYKDGGRGSCKASATASIANSGRTTPLSSTKKDSDRSTLTPIGS